MHRFIAVLIAIAAVTVCWPYRGVAEQEQDKAGKTVKEGKQSKLGKVIMEEKLKDSQKLLEGIALADFNKITRNSEELIRLSNTTEWMVFKTLKYELYSNEFRRAAENVIAKAKLKNIDGVTLAYFELTMSCVRCHTYVREIRDARLPIDGPAIGEAR